MNNLTVVMYHYVRPLKETRFPGIKGLDLQLFKEQLKFLRKNYNFVTMEDLIGAKYHNQTLPMSPVLLTFDDAYLDHFLYVYPILKKMQIQGSFFAPVKAIKDNYILDVNKIHFILASAEDKLDSILKDIKDQLNYFQDEFNLETFDEYYKRLAIANRFDSKDIIFIKRLLQVELPEKLRKNLNAFLFKKYLNISDECFRNELYMNQDHCQHLVSDGMHFGSHGYNHHWWSKLSASEIELEVKKSTDFLLEIGANKDNLTVCYPYGAYNEKAIKILNDYNYKLGFTTKVDLVNLDKVSALELPRLDTNDLPKNSASHPNHWFKKISF